MTFKRDGRISILALQAFGCLQDHRLRRQEVQNVGEEEGIFQKGHTRPGGVKKTFPDQFSQVYEGQCKTCRCFTTECPAMKKNPSPSLQDCCELVF
uniref:Uncharacterized protein n=1 Tax=Lepeophtheirus salmonis TaxID=72036 RepID=A0A0K2TL41_LEPSM